MEHRRWWDDDDVLYKPPTVGQEMQEEGLDNPDNGYGNSAD
jgi:hypothetical protein